MRFRALAAALVFPLGLLAACGGGDDSGLTNRDDESSDTTDEESSDTTEEDSSDTTEEDSSDTTEEGSSDTSADDSDTSIDLGDDDEVREQAIDAFVELGLSEEDATCLIDAIGVDQLIDIGLGSGGDVSNVDPDQINVIIDAISECDIDPTVLTGGG
jgi:hypothetical protein